MNKYSVWALAILVIILIGSKTLFAADPSTFRNTLMPEPSSILVGQGALPITADFTVSVQGASSALVERAALRMIDRLKDQTGLQLVQQVAHNDKATVTISVLSDGPEIQTVEEDESYKLSATASSLHIEAVTRLGALHGMETLLQLVQADNDGFEIPVVTIEDSPRFRWRGLMIDCGRHFVPLEVLKRNIDAMAAVKLNVFHWHLTEDQGFRMESKVFPKLTGEGSDGLFYTQDQARELVRYAADRGIRVVPEFEMPGHSTAWLVAYPELASGRAPSGIRREFGISDYALDPTRKETYSFLDRFLTEMSTIFPDQFVHIGGDETPAPDWKQDPRIQAFMQAHELQDNAALQAYFNQRVLKILTRLHKSMVGWDEVFNPALPKDVVVQSWRGEASLAKGAQSGYRGLLSAPYYLDSMKPASVHYLADPIPADTSLTPAEQRLILGGEICAWGEQLNQYSIDSRIWPRTAAIAERFWSPQNLRDVDDMYRRLDTVSIELEGLGLQHLTTEDVQLRSLAGSEKIAALRIFASAFEPANFDQRVKQQHPTQLTPMTSFVDAVRPDPPVRHEIEMAVKEFLKDPVSSSAESAEARKTLQQFFASLAQSVPEVESAITSAPRLQTLRPRVEQLSHLAVIGEEAIDDLSNDKSAPPKWKHQSLAQIDADRGALGMVRFDFLQPLTDLVNATHQ